MHILLNTTTSYHQYFRQFKYHTNIQMQSINQSINRSWIYIAHTRKASNAQSKASEM